MTEPNENFLTDLAKQFKIAQNVPTSEHLKVLKKLERIDSDKLTLILNYFLTIEVNKEVLVYFVKLLGKLQNNLTLDILSEMILSILEDYSDESTKLKCEIANTLGKSKNSSMVMPLLYVLNNKNENYKVRLSCAEALGHIGSSYAVTPLIEVVKDNEEKSMYLRESAAKALGMLGDNRAVEPLADILESRNGLFDKFTFLKERIVETLGRLGEYDDKKSIKALKNALEDDAHCIRCSAIEALSEIDDERVVPLIEKMLDDENEEVVKTAIFALYEICGAKYLQSIAETKKLKKIYLYEIKKLVSDSLNDGCDDD